MRTFVIFFLLINIGLINAQYTAIPDPYFEQNLISQGIDTEGILDGQVLTADIEEVTFLAYLSPYIQDLTGIEGFAALEVLHCGNILQLYSLDVSQNTNLEELYCRSTPLYSLDTSGCVNLRVLDCGYCPLSSLDVSNNVLLEQLICNSNILTSLDISNNPLLWFLNCSANQITELDVGINTELLGLYFRYNAINNIDLSQNSQLLSIGCGNNLLTQLDISNNMSLVALFAQNNDLTDLVLDDNISLEVLNCSDNDLQSLSVQNGANHLLTGTYTSGNGQDYNRFRATGNPDLTCIFVDDAAYCTENWLETDPASTFIETQAECDALDISDITQEATLTVFPNPANNMFNVQANVLVEVVKIYNVLGTYVKTTRLQNNYNISNLEAGLYIVHVKTKNGIITEKLIIEDK